MSNAEETPESSRNRGSFVDEFLESGRQKAKTFLSTQDDKHIEDLEYILKSVKALVKIIEEIWNNCKDHLLTSTENDEFPLTFEREEFEEAKVEKNGRNLTITTQKVSNGIDFRNPPAVPENLGEMINIGRAQAKYDILPNYNKYLEKTSILCEDVLLPFLTGFKEHLENVQVYLGQIEAWLREPEVVDSFLKKTFNGPGIRDDEYPHKIILYESYCLDVDSRMEIKYNLCTEDEMQGLKKAFSFVKTFKPVTQIEVKDAGEKGVNGTYTLDGQYDSVYGYTRLGHWDEKPVTFYLYRVRDPDERRRWCIGCTDVIQNFTFFYWAEGTGEEYELPPLNGWKGVNPSPQIVYKIDD